MSSISQHLDPARLADLARDPDYTTTPPQIAAWDFFAQARDAYRARKLGAVSPRKLPCPSDADPGANDMPENRADMLTCIVEAISKLEDARRVLEGGMPACELAARSLMNEAADWATEADK